MQSEAAPKSQEVMSLKNLIASFLLAMRNYALYPEDHSICLKSSDALMGHMEKCTNRRGCLHLDVEKTRLLYQGDVVLLSPSEEDSLPFLLYSEGIHWIEFHRGITNEEVSTFLKLLIRYRFLKGEQEGNLVTSLWERGLAHLKYKIDDSLWKSEVLIDLSSLKPAKEHSYTSEEVGDTTPSILRKMTVTMTDTAVWRLMPEEEAKLHDMVREEESRDTRHDVIDMVETILKNQGDPENFTAIVNYLIEEFQFNLAQGDFQSCVDLLEYLHGIDQVSAQERPWAVQILKDMRKRISSPEILGALEPAWPLVNVMDAPHFDLLRQLLLLLPTNVMLSIGTMLTDSRFPRIDNLIMEVLSIHAERDLDQLALLLEMADESILLKIIEVLHNMKGKDPSPILFKLTRHSSDGVRIGAINALLIRNPENLRELFPLIENPRSSVRRQILAYLGKQKNPLAEALLLDYLAKQHFRIKDTQYILSCYRALGQCASSQAVPFLKNILLYRDWKALLGMSTTVHRQGAALALLAMKDNPAARACLQTASKSLYHSVRHSYRQAVREDKRLRRELGH